MNKIKDAPLSAGVVHYNMEAYGENLISRKRQHVGLHCISALAELKFKVFLCATAYPEPQDSLARIGLDVTSHLDGFVKAIGRNEILPFLGAYQRLVYSYFFFKKLTKKHKPRFSSDNWWIYFDP